MRTAATPGLSALLLKGADLPRYVSAGIAALGVVGSDTLDELDADLLLLDRVANKWSVLVMATLWKGPLRFNELKRTVGGVGLAPSAAKRMAVAAPMPVPPPVMNATLSCRRPCFMLCSLR